MILIIATILSTVIGWIVGAELGKQSLNFKGAMMVTVLFLAGVFHGIAICIYLNL